MSSSRATSADAGTISAEEKRILELCEQFRQGITHQVIQNDLPHLKPQQLVDALNKLLAKSKVELLTKGDGTPVYKLKNAINQHKLRGADKEEQAVYEIIERSGACGIWARKIRAESNLHLNTVEKVLRRLESKKLVKSINSVQAPKKKIYLVCGVEPDRSLTGGAFYSDNQFDSTFVDILMETCYKYLYDKLRSSEEQGAEHGPLVVINAAKTSAQEMQDYLHRLKLAKVKLSVEDVEKLLDTLELDCRVVSYAAGFVAPDGAAAAGPSGSDGDGSSSSSSSSTKLWRALPEAVKAPYLLMAPCGVCPLIDRCADIGNVTPQSCQYLDEWLS